MYLAHIFSEEGVKWLGHPGLLATFFFCLPIFFSPCPPGSWSSIQPAFPATGPHHPLVLLAVTWPLDPLAWLWYCLFWRGDRSTCATQCPFTVSPQTLYGKSRSSIFHISSFTRRVELDISTNYLTFLPSPQEKNNSTHLSMKVLTAGSIRLMQRL